MKPDQFLIYGHAHYPTQHPREPLNKKVANTGIWGFGEDKKLCYVEIKDDKVYNMYF
ncbi:hypothetical protein [Methanosarcina acetivorans]|uniref:hypothetical protein n=1 Tax=Methanosarcina acetivorans TaxID=2214 RepID=UPI0012FEBB7B|nr:hypothetical protein [Methanosarcina acetivorans]